MAPLWIVGVLVGWAWRPKWVNFGRELLVSSMPACGLCFMAKPSLSSFSDKDSRTFIDFTRIPSFSWLKLHLHSCISWISDDGLANDTSLIECRSHADSEKSSLVIGDDLEHLCRLVEVKDGGPSWIQMMERSTPTMFYQAWRRDPEFPFFCSDREYIIGRRIWESGRSYYCVTKGVPCSSIPRRNKPRRVELYHSSWCIRAVESKRGTSNLTACEVLLFHHEDMGIPWDIAKFGVRQGMWGAVKKIEPGLRAYQKHRSSGSPLSRSAVMAQINTKFYADYLISLEISNDNANEAETSESCEKPMERNIPKLLIVGGAIVLACSLDRGLLTKAVIFGFARKFAKIAGRRL